MIDCLIGGMLDQYYDHVLDRKKIFKKLSYEWNVW